MAGTQREGRPLAINHTDERDRPGAFEPVPPASDRIEPRGRRVMLDGPDHIPLPRNIVLSMCAFVAHQDTKTAWKRSTPGYNSPSDAIENPTAR